MGGHAEALLSTLPEVRVVGIDRDPDALTRAEARLQPFAGRVDLVHARYDELAQVLADLRISEVQGVLLDLGVSSMQLDRVERGFSYSRDAPLDMRMDPTTGATAADVLASYPAEKLARVLREYGDERFASRIAHEIVATRDVEPLRTSSQLVDLLTRTIPARSQRTGGHPAKRTFQALRIEVNDELGGLRRALPAALDALAVSGRLVVMSYQSLEDRIVKKTFAFVTQAQVPPDLPVIPPDSRPRFRLLTRGAQVASDADIHNNPRAAPVRLRAVERTTAKPARAATMKEWS
jgi:16S rRNA (cytosine1402-N4)-methyltransferase